MLSVVNAIRLHRVVYPLLLPSPPRGCRSERDADPRAEKKPGDVEKPEFRSAMEPADDLAGLGFADKYRERAKVIVSSLAHIKGAETIADYRCVGGSKLIGHGDVNICLGIVI